MGDSYETNLDAINYANEPVSPESPCHDVKLGMQSRDEQQFAAGTMSGATSADLACSWLHDKGKPTYDC